MTSPAQYRGRFAPSPTGPLHLGSLAAALASYLEAKIHHGHWLLRIEDLDPPREDPQARQSIPQCLLQHGLQWDGEISFQSQRSTHYENTLQQLHTRNLVYNCPCSRSQLASNNGQHGTNCPQTPPLNRTCAIRMQAKNRHISWNDLFQGQQHLEISEDFVLKRKEGLYAYQLAVVTDDHLQGITHVVRGADLLDSTPMQLCLYQGLDWKAPQFGHIPVILGPDGQKLSKQNLAPAIDPQHASRNLIQALNLLGLGLTDDSLAPHQILAWALEHWPRVKISKTLEIYQHPRDNAP